MHTLTLGTSAIRQLDGLYSLNDLHAAAGGEAKNQPALFMRNDQTQALIAEIHSTDSQSASKTINGGPNRGTYVCRELVYAYAMWISPKFNLQVIRAFDALHGQRQAPKPEPLPMLFTPAPDPSTVHRLKCTVEKVTRTTHGGIRLQVACGELGFGINLPAMSQRPSFRVGDILRLECLKQSNPMCGPYTAIYHDK